MILIFLFHAFYSSLIGYVLAALFGQLTMPAACVALALAVWPAWRHARLWSKNDSSFGFMKFSEGVSGVLEVVLFAFILFAGLRHFLFLFYDSSHSIMTLDIFNLGDLPLHINYIRMFANGAHFPPVNPGFPTEALRYPFGPDFYNGLWETIGLRTQLHLFAVGFFATVASLVMLRRYGGWWAVGAFFLNGGLIGWSVVQGAPLTEWQSQLDWKNLFVTVFLTQRGVLFAVPAGLFLLTELRRHLTTRVMNTEQMIAFGLIWGVLPFFHAHAFVAISLMMFGLVIIEKGLSGVVPFFTSRFALVAYLPALYFIWRTTNGFAKSSVIHWDAAWTSTPDQLPEFLWKNFGPWLIVVVLIPLLAKKDQRAKVLAEWALYFGLFVLFFNVMLAPWAWDNIKVLIWPYLGLAALAQKVFEPRLQIHEGPRTPAAARALPWIKVPIAALLFLSGALAIIFTLAKPSDRATTVYNDADVAETEGAISGIGPDAIFAANPSYNHALTAFGRVRVMDYDGHMWSHGIDYQPTQTLLTHLLKGEADWREAAKTLNVTHIFWGPGERLAFGEGHRAWMDEFKNISRVSNIQVYELHAVKE